jgi:two-component system response regulator YesN
MYNLLIVEDFKVDRQNLRSILNSLEGIDINIVGECKNGREALEFIGENSVDIILSDIEMPYMNGLELAQNVNVKYPNIKIIFCSLYDEFEYARKALYLNISGYILKPFDKDELLKCLKDVIEQINTESGFRKEHKEYQELKKVLEDNKPQLLDSFMRGIIYGTIADEQDILDKSEYLGVRLSKDLFALVYIEIDDYEKITNNKTVEQKQLFSIKLYERVKETSKKFEGSYIISIDDSHFAYLVNCSLDDDIYGKCTELAIELINEFKLSGVSITISISDACNNIRDIKTLLQQCTYIMRYKFILGNGKVLKSQDIPSGIQSLDIDLNSINVDIKFLLNSGSREDIQKYVSNIFKSDSQMINKEGIRSICLSITLCVIFVLNENNESLNPLFNDINLVWKGLLKFETITDARNWIENILVLANEQLSRKASGKYRLIVEEIEKIIKDNYMKPISVETIADELHYSPNYLSYVFKKETGETITDYMSKIKMEKAKEMLLDIRNKIYNVSEALGYSNSAYFCSVFKKFTSMTPNEYRERNISTD